LASARVSVLTPHRKGGPFNWGKNLVESINGSGHHKAGHVHDIPGLLSAPLWQDADLIHTTVPLAVRLWKKPVMLTVHGDYSIENNVWKYLYPHAIRMADAVTTPSTFLKERLSLDRAEVIPNAVFPERFRAPVRDAGDVVNLVTVTKFYFEDKAQGVLDLLRILERAKKSTDHEVWLTVVGGGKYLRPVRKKAGASTVNVHFTGFLDRPAEALERGDIFIYYSTHDNFPITILEAMASGLPVLTNDVGAAREIIENGRDGYVARTDEEYAEHLCRLIEDPELRQAMGRQARKTVEEKFSWPTVVEKYTALYQNLIE